MTLCLSVYKLHRSTHDYKTSTEKVLPCTKPSVRACTHTPLWSINSLINCTHITKIEGPLTHTSVCSYECVCRLKRTHMYLWRGLHIFYIIQHSDLFASFEATTLLNIYIYIYIYISAYTYHLYLYSIIHTFLLCEIPFSANREL